MERATGTEVYGCGSSQTTDITLNIQTTTGGNFSISLNGQNTVEHLKKLVSKKLRVSKDRICLLHRERQLRDGTLEDNGLLDGSRVILLPSVETGLLSQRPENSVMQALESLNDSQVNDFLSGKSPLNLTMRLGDHMMLIQLQLSTLNGSSTGRSLRTSNSSKGTSSVQTQCDMKGSKKSPQKPTDRNKLSAEEKDKVTKVAAELLAENNFEMLHTAFGFSNILTEQKNGNNTEENKEKDESADTTNCTISDLSDTSAENDQSPIKSLSNLVSSPIDATSSERDHKMDLVNDLKDRIIKFLSKTKLTDSEKPSTSATSKLTDSATTTSAMSDKPSPPLTSQTPDSSLSDDSGDNFTDQSSFLAESTIDEYPMENLFNSAVDKGLFENQDETMMDREISNLATTSHGSQDSNTTLPSFQSINEPLKNKRFQYLLHKTSKFKHPIGQNKQKAFMQSVVNKHKKRMQHRQENNLAQPSTSRTEPYITNSRKLILQPSSGQADDNATPSTSKQCPFRAPKAPKKPARALSPPIVDTKALIEASKNLTQKLKKLSKEVLTNKIDRSPEDIVHSRIGSRAVIESMKHHGKGIYSGTFSGTLNPCLQDKHGRPKRDISTIIHILNDLLCATPSIAASPKDSKHTCSGDDSSKCLVCQAACTYGQCDGHAAGASDAARCVCEPGAERPRAEPEASSTCAAHISVGEDCNKCDIAKALALDNSKTKCKLEQLRLVMQQKKQRREARKQKTLPYPSPSAKTMASPEQPAIQEEIETVA